MTAIVRTVVSLSTAFALAGCAAEGATSGSETMLPLSYEADGKTALAGAYVVESGMFWLTETLAQELQSVAGGGDIVFVSDDGVERSLDVLTGGVLVAPDLAPGSTIRIRVLLPSGGTDLFAILRVEDKAWIDTLSEEDAETRFASCPLPPITAW